jgi:hypothetical protein
MADDTEELIRKAQSKVSSTISSIEAAIASYDAMQKKPEEHAKTIAAMRRLLSRLEYWEKKSLKNMSAGEETKKKDIKELISIADSSKGDF